MVAYFGVDMAPLVERLVGERLEDGGWNCLRADGSLRSSFATTINVLEGLLEYERATGGTADSVAARGTGEEFLLARGLFRRLSTGTPADGEFLRFAHPNRWHYDVLRALDYLRSAGVPTGAAPDPRLGDAVDYVRSRRLGDGTWPLDRVPAGRHLVPSRRRRGPTLALGHPPGDASPQVVRSSEQEPGPERHGSVASEG